MRKQISIQLTLLMPLSKLVSGRAPTMSFAIAPKLVASPVAATTATAVPLTTLVPMREIEARLRSGMHRGTPQKAIPKADIRASASVHELGGPRRPPLARRADTIVGRYRKKRAVAASFIVWVFPNYAAGFLDGQEMVVNG